MTIDGGLELCNEAGSSQALVCGRREEGTPSSPPAAHVCEGDVVGGSEEAMQCCAVEDRRERRRGLVPTVRWQT